LLALVWMNDKHDFVMTHVISLRLVKKQPLAMRLRAARLQNGGL